uniref:Ig-like domain-containing protein n=1 Tax=Anopheles farauti TaxID=69004 RepID=A0A182Q9I8_9DIPT
MPRASPLPVAKQNFPAHGRKKRGAVGLRQDDSYVQVRLSVYGQSTVNVQLVVKKYVERGSPVALYCENDVLPDILYKVTFLKEDSKIFEYIKGRSPPYRNYSIPGAEIDWKKVTPSTLTLKNVDYDASGSYYCEVSTDTPIFTKASNDETLHVMLPQKGPPTIEFAKKQLYYGDMLIANCTTSRARPPPHITWLINGKQVDDAHVRQLHHNSKNSHRSKAQQIISKTTIYHGKVVGSGNIGTSGSVSLKELKERTKGNLDGTVENDFQDKLTKSTSSMGLGGGNGGYSGGGFEIQPNIGYNSFESGYNYGIKMHHPGRERSGGSTIGLLNGAFGGPAYGSFGGMAGLGSLDWIIMYALHLAAGSPPAALGCVSSASLQPLMAVHGSRPSSEHKYRRHLYEGTYEPRKSHRVSASYSQLSIRITEALTNNLGRIEITCLATIPAHVEPGEQYADYKTSLIKLDIEQNDQTSPQPSMSGMAAFGNSGAAQNSFHSVHVRSWSSVALLALAPLALATVAHWPVCV